MQPWAYSSILTSTISEQQIAARNPLFNRRSVTGIESAQPSLDQSLLEPSDESVDCVEEVDGFEKQNQADIVDYLVVQPVQKEQKANTSSHF